MIDDLGNSILEKGLIMSMIIKVKTVIVNEDGSGELRIVFMGFLHGLLEFMFKYDKAPEEITALNGLNVTFDSPEDDENCRWLMLGKFKIADIDDDDKLVFCNDEEFKQAIKERSL